MVTFRGPALRFPGTAVHIFIPVQPIGTVPKARQVAIMSDGLVQASVERCQSENDFPVSAVQNAYSFAISLPFIFTFIFTTHSSPSINQDDARHKRQGERQQGRKGCPTV